MKLDDETLGLLEQTIAVPVHGDGDVEPVAAVVVRKLVADLREARALIAEFLDITGDDDLLESQDEAETQAFFLALMRVAVKMGIAVGRLDLEDIPAAFRIVCGLT